jgi:UDP-glucuronate decarboxylase
MSKNILVTGAAGFLGSHLVARHIAAGDYVVGVDSFVSSKKDSKHVLDFNDNKNIALLELDICSARDLEDCSDIMAELDQNFDVIYNFACPASPPIYQSMPLYTMQTCVVGTSNILELAREHGAVVVHASTSEVYGDPTVSPQSESYRGYVNSYGPRSCYDEGKRAAEAICYDYMHQWGIDARLVRIFNTYGPHMQPDDGRVITNFVMQALRNKPMTVYGDGVQTRSLCYVDDLISAIVRLGELSYNPSTPINIGNPHEVSVQWIAEQIKELTNSSSEIVYKQLPTDDPRQRCPDITLAKKILNWEPKVDVIDGLKQTIEYFKKIVG